MLIGERYDFAFRFEVEERGNGHGGSDVRKYGWFEKAAAEGVFLSADENLRALFLSIADVPFDLGDGGIINERFLGGIGLEAKSGLESFDSVGEFLLYRSE